jgi:hypothetical protein
MLGTCKERSLAFDSDDDDDRPSPKPSGANGSDADSGKQGAGISGERPRRAGESDPTELGKLAVDLPDGAASHQSSAGDDSDDAIDAAALAALSKGRPGRRGAPDDGEGSRVKLAGAASAARSSRAPSSAPPPARKSFGWLIALALGFAAGIPVGSILFPRPATGPDLAQQRPAAGEETEPQGSEAEARARAEDEVAARVRLPMPAAAREPAADQAAAPPQPSAASAEPAAAVEPLAAATDLNAAAAPGANAAVARALPTSAAPGRPGAIVPVPDAQARAAARAATEALNSGRPLPDSQALAPQPSAAAASPGVAPAAPPQAAAAAPAAPQPGDEPRSVDDLLDDALSSSARKTELAHQADRVQPSAATAQRTPTRADAALAPNALPMQLSREDVTKTMTVLLPAIRGCAAGQSGLATVGIVVKNDGHVESVSVSGAPFEGDRSGRCMEGVVRRAKFPRFQQSSFRIQFPFAIQ